jgi:copper chaperone
MKSIRSFLSRKAILFVVLIFLAINVAVALGYKASKKDIKPLSVTEISNTGETFMINEDLSKVILSVRDMSCSGCISTIKASLSDIQGIKDILVDISNGKTEVFYDAKKLSDVSRIMRAITASGYPARVLRVVSTDEIEKERDLAAAKSRYYIASVGGYDIARADFDTELGVAKKRYLQVYGDRILAGGQGKPFVDTLKIQILSRLINEGVLMQEIDKSNFRIDADTVERGMQTFFRESGKNVEDFKKALNEVGYSFEYFKKKFETKVLVNKYLNERIMADASNQYEKQSLFSSWFNNAKGLAEVVYYDKDLERLLKNQSDSGSCCSVK